MGREESVSLTAEVDNEGNPLAGATVTFTSADNGIATVSPSSGITDASGRTNTTVSGLSSCGSTEVTVTANHSGKTASSKATIEVPASSNQGLIVTFFVLFTVMIVMNRKRSIKKAG